MFFLFFTFFYFTFLFFHFLIFISIFLNKLCLLVWSAVIKDKYLPSISVATWLFTAPIIPKAASQTWRILNKSAHWITSWISSNLGSGHSIMLGTERILGLSPSSYLSPSLLSHLHSKCIHFLFQASVHNQPGFPDPWMNFG